MTDSTLPTHIRWVVHNIKLTKFTNTSLKLKVTFSFVTESFMCQNKFSLLICFRKKNFTDADIYSQESPSETFTTYFSKIIVQHLMVFK